MTRPHPRPLEGRAFRRLALLAGLALAGCAGPEHRPIVGEPTGHPGFPSALPVGSAWAEAEFVEDHSRAFDRDLLVEDGLVPVHLRIGLQDRSERGAALDDGVLDPVLFLQDGTALPWVPLEELDERNDAVSRYALRSGLLEPWDRTPGGFLYFSAAEVGVRVQGRHGLIVGERLNRELDLAGSVLAFTLKTPTGPQRVHVGLDLGLWEGGR